jgi:1-acyl-sn-glycerol-3-phosphate acyltransferase
MLALRSALFNLLFYIVAGGYFIVLIPVLALPRIVAMRCAQTLVRILLFLLRRVAGIDWEVRGPIESLRRSALIASKHQSAWDTIIFFVLCDNGAYVMKRELMWIPVYGWFASRMDHIPIDRSGRASAIKHLMRDARRVHADGRSIVVFPQGTRVLPGQSAPYQPGVVALYEALNVPVIPLALNSGLFWGKRSFLRYPGKITIQILPEIPAGLPRAEFRRRLEAEIEAGTQRLEAEVMTHRR